MTSEPDSSPRPDRQPESEHADHADKVPESAENFEHVLRRLTSRKDKERSKRTSD